MFPEGRNIKLAATASGDARSINVGWSPMVTGAITSYDGGKVMCGFGRKTSTVYIPWVTKMWGSVGANNCGANASITGYVQMQMVLNANLTTANCVLTADASVQWAFTTLSNSGNGLNTAVTNNNTSMVYLDVAEDWKIGGASAGDGVDPYYFAVGGGTGTNTVAWGLLAWEMIGSIVDLDGNTAGTAVTEPQHKIPIMYGVAAGV